MLPEYTERIDILTWNIQAQEPELKKYSEDQFLTAFLRLHGRSKSALSKRDRNIKLLVFRYQYRLSFNAIGKAHGITTERVRQLVFHEMRALKKILSEG